MNSESQEQTGLYTLPTELCVNILQWLSCRDLFTCRKVSSTLNTLIRDNVSLQYVNELAGADLQDNPSCFLSIAEKVGLLQDHRPIINDLGDIKYSDLEYFGPTLRNLCRASGGVVARVSSASDATRFSFLKFRSVACQATQAWSVHIQEACSSILDFLIDPGQDLLVIVLANELKFLTMSTGMEHPRALKGSIRATTTFKRDEVKIAGDHASSFFSEGWQSGVSRFWNWTNHEVIHESSVSQLHKTAISFFDARHIASADICNTTQSATISVQSITGCMQRAKFYLPPLRHRRQYTSVTMHSEPITSWDSASSNSECMPFFPAAPDRLIVFQFHLEGGMSVAISTLCTRLLQFLEEGTSVSEIQVPWGDWIPQCASVVVLHWSKPYAHISGTKMIVWGQGFVDIYSFNEVALQQAKSCAHGIDQYLLRSTNHDADDVFAEPLPASLPYLKRKAAIEDDDMHREELVYVHGNSVLFTRDHGAWSALRYLSR